MAKSRKSNLLRKNLIITSKTCNNTGRLQNPDLGDGLSDAFDPFKVLETVGEYTQSKIICYVYKTSD